MCTPPPSPSPLSPLSDCHRCPPSTLLPPPSSLHPPPSTSPYSSWKSARDEGGWVRAWSGHQPTRYRHCRAAETPLNTRGRYAWWTAVSLGLCLMLKEEEGDERWKLDVAQTGGSEDLNGYGIWRLKKRTYKSIKPYNSCLWTIKMLIVHHHNTLGLSWEKKKDEN